MNKPLHEQILTAMGFKPKHRYVWVLTADTRFGTHIVGVFDKLEGAQAACPETTNWVPRLSKRDTAVEGSAGNVVYRAEERRIR